MIFQIAPFFPPSSSSSAFYSNRVNFRTADSALLSRSSESYSSVMNGRNCKRSGYRLNRPFRWLRALHCEFVWVRERKKADTNEPRETHTLCMLKTTRNTATEQNRPVHASGAQQLEPKIYIAISVFLPSSIRIWMFAGCGDALHSWNYGKETISLAKPFVDCFSVGEGDLTGNAWFS